MCKAMEELIEIMIFEDKKLSALRILERGMLTKTEIAECLRLPLEVIEELADSLQTV